MKRKVRLRLDVYQRDLAGEKLAPEVEAIALAGSISRTVALRNWSSQGPYYNVGSGHFCDLTRLPPPQLHKIPAGPIAK